MAGERARERGGLFYFVCLSGYWWWGCFGGWWSGAGRVDGRLEGGDGELG